MKRYIGGLLLVTIMLSGPSLLNDSAYNVLPYENVQFIIKRDEITPEDIDNLMKAINKNRKTISNLLKTKNEGVQDLQDILRKKADKKEILSPDQIFAYQEFSDFYEEAGAELSASMMALKEKMSVTPLQEVLKPNTNLNILYNALGSIVSLQERVIVLLQAIALKARRVFAGLAPVAV